MAPLDNQITTHPWHPDQSIDCHGHGHKRIVLLSPCSQLQLAFPDLTQRPFLHRPQATQSNMGQTQVAAAVGTRRVRHPTLLLALLLLLQLPSLGQADPLRVDQWDKKLTGKKGEVGEMLSRVV